MRQKTRRVKKQGFALTKPEVQYVSLVDHGANQTPLSVVKRHKEDTMATKQRADVPTKKSAAGANTVGIRKIMFATEVYPTEEAVKAYLSANDWEGYEKITKTDDFFVVEAEGLDDSDFERLSYMEMPDEKGVKVAVGILKEVDDSSDDDDEDDDDKDKLAAKEADGTPEGSNTEFEFSVDEDTAKALELPVESGQDAPVNPLACLADNELFKSVALKDITTEKGVLDRLAYYMQEWGEMPGFYEVTSAFRQEFANSFSAENPEEAISKALDEYVMVIKAMSSMFLTLIRNDSTVLNSILEKIADEAPQTSADTTAEKSADEEGFAMNEEVTKAVNEAVEAAVAKAIEAATEANKALVDQVTELSSKVETLHETVEKRISEAKDETTAKSVTVPPVSNSISDLEAAKRGKESAGTEDDAIAAKRVDTFFSRNTLGM